MFLRYLRFCPYFFDHIGKRVDKKAKLNFEIYVVINGETNTATTIHVLPNISRGNDNHTVEFDQDTECNKCSNLLKKSCQK